MTCLVCGASPVDKCHIRSKGSGGSNDECNIILFCRGHHRIQHNIGWYRLCEKFPIVHDALKEKGWEIVKEFDRYKLVRKS